MYKANTTPSLTLVGKATPDKLESEQSNLTARKSRKGNKLKELVNKGTLNTGMKVNVSSTKVGMLSGHIRDFNFTTGKILVELEPLHLPFEHVTILNGTLMSGYQVNVTQPHN